MRHLIIVIALLAGCGSGDVASVRFYNAMHSGADIRYGIRIGDAEHDFGLANGAITEYYQTLEGTYPVQMKASDASWSDDPVPITLKAGRSYTIIVKGNSSDWYYDLLLDHDP